MGLFTDQLTATISSSGSVSSACQIGGRWSLVAIKYPAAWTAAVVTFLVSFDGSTWENLLDDAGNEVTKTVTAGEFRELDSSEFKTAIHIKVRSGTAATPVVQQAERAISLYKRRYLS